MAAIVSTIRTLMVPWMISEVATNMGANEMAVFLLLRH